MLGMAKALCHSKTTPELVKCHSERWHPVPWFPPHPLTRDFRWFFPHKSSRKLPHTLETQERWTIKEMELSTCTCTTDSLFHGDCPHCFGHAVQCNWVYFSCFVIIAAAGSGALQKLNLFSTFTDFKHFGLYFCIRLGINIMEQNLTKTSVHSNSCRSIFIDH